MMKTRFLAFVIAVSSGAALAAGDWPQWQGPDRTRMSKETGLLKEWPAGGPRVIWTASNLGTGYGSMSVAGDRVFVQGEEDIGPLEKRDERSGVGQGSTPVFVVSGVRLGKCRGGRAEGDQAQNGSQS